MSHQSLRARLREETRPAHDRVDARFSAYDLTQVTGFSGFLAAQYVAFRALSDAGFALADRPAALAADDLTTLGRDIPDPVGAVDPRPDPVSVEYVLRGAQLGGRVLSRIWAGSDDPRVRAAKSYMQADDDMAGWKTLCADLAAQPGHGAAADRVIRDAEAVFDLFARAALRFRPLQTQDFHDA